MKSLSGSIVVAAGLATLVAGAMMRGSSDTGLFIMSAGGLVSLLGLAFWIKSLSEP